MMLPIVSATPADSDAEVVVGRSNAEVVEEHLIQFVVAVLVSVHQHVLGRAVQLVDQRDSS